MSNYQDQPSYSAWVDKQTKQDEAYEFIDFLRECLQDVKGVNSPFGKKKEESR